MGTQSPRPGANPTGAAATDDSKDAPRLAQATAAPQTHAERAFTEPAIIGTPAESAAAHVANALQLLRVLPDELWALRPRQLGSIVKRLRRAHALMLSGHSPRAAGEPWQCAWCGVVHAADVESCPHFPASLALVDLAHMCAVCRANPVPDGYSTCDECRGRAL